MKVPSQVWCGECDEHHLCEEDHGEVGHGGASICCPVKRQAERTGAEKYLDQRKEDPEYRQAYEEAQDDLLRADLPQPTQSDPREGLPLLEQAETLKIRWPEILAVVLIPFFIGMGVGALLVTLVS